MSLSILNRLAAYWPLTELTGTRADSSVNKVNLAMAGSILGNLDPRGQAATYDGNNSNFLSVADNTKLRMGNTSYSLSLLFKLTTITGATQTIVGKYANENRGGEYGLEYFPGAGLVWSVFPNGDPNAAAALVQSVIIPGTNPLVADTWYHVVARKTQDGQVDARINGGPLGAPRAGFLLNAGGFEGSTARFGIGTRVSSLGAAGTVPIVGLVRQAGVWNRLLEEQEVQLLYGNGYGLSAAQEREIAAGVYVG